MGSVRLGAKYAVEEYLRVNSRHRVVILTDRKASRLAKAILDAARKRTSETHFFIMEDYCNGKRRKFPREIMHLFEDPEQKVVSFYLASNGNNQKGFELLRMGDPVAALIDKEEPRHIKHASMSGISRKIMQQGMCVSNEILRKYSNLIYRRVKGAKRIEIISPGGTELELILDPKNVIWHKEDHIDYGRWENLPLGEAYTSPIDCNGRLVIDCMVGGGYEEKYGFGFLERYPLTFKIEKGKVTNISCKRPTQLIGSLETDVFKMDDAANNVGEIGYGTNFGINRLIGNILQDEKAPSPGVHIGIGSSEPYCGEDWRSGNHIDLMMLEPSVYVDGRLLIENGIYKLRNGNGRK